MSKWKPETGPAEYMRFSLIQSCAIDDVRVNDSMLKVLVALGSYASKKNSHWCWTKQNTIAKRLGVSRQLVSKAANDLASCGYVEIRDAFHPIDGARVSSSYRLLLDFELPTECLRSEQPRRRAGIGGRRKAPPRNSEFTSPRNSEFTSPATDRVASPATLSVASPATDRVAALNPESENGKIKRRTNARSSPIEMKNAGSASAPHRPFVKPITEIRRDVGDTPPIPSCAAPLSPAPGIWRRMRERMDTVTTPIQRKEYLDRLDLFHVEAEDWALVAPTVFTAEYVTKQWGKELAAELHRAAGPDAQLHIISLPKGTPV